MRQYVKEALYQNLNMLRTLFTWTRKPDSFACESKFGHENPNIRDYIPNYEERQILDNWTRRSAEFADYPGGMEMVLLHSDLDSNSSDSECYEKAQKAFKNYVEDLGSIAKARGYEPNFKLAPLENWFKGNPEAMDDRMVQYLLGYGEKSCPVSLVWQLPLVHYCKPKHAEGLINEPVNRLLSSLADIGSEGIMDKVDQGLVDFAVSDSENPEHPETLAKLVPGLVSCSELPIFLEGWAPIIRRTTGQRSLGKPSMTLE